MPRIRLQIEYDGTAYAGWQMQENALSIQQVVQEAWNALTGEDAVLHASGRTDGGVHALGQVAHVDTQTRIAPEKLCYALNMRLPKDIRVTQSQEVSTEFHARFSAVGKHYRYGIHHAPHASALCRNITLHEHRRLDIAAMQQAAACIVGRHDFSAFMSTGSAIHSTVRDVYVSQLTHAGTSLTYDVAGNGFLYNMVRIIVGALIDIGRGHLPVETVRQALVQGKRSLLGPTAPAHGLTLVQVFYAPHTEQDIVRIVEHQNS